MKLLITIEAEHEEASGVPLQGLLVETMGVLTRMGFQAPEYTLELDGPDSSSHTVKELSEDIFPEAPEDASHLTSQEIRGMIDRPKRSIGIELGRRPVGSPRQPYLERVPETSGPVRGSGPLPCA